MGKSGQEGGHGRRRRGRVNRDDGVCERKAFRNPANQGGRKRSKGINHSQHTPSPCNRKTHAKMTVHDQTETKDSIEDGVVGAAGDEGGGSEGDEGC